MPDINDHAVSLMDDIDPRLLRLIQTQINTFVKWDLVRFFHNNPHTTDTVESIARYVGRDMRIIEPEMLQLAEDGILEMEDLAGMRVYTLSPNDATRDLIHSFITACDDRQFRIKAIYHVIRSLR